MLTTPLKHVDGRRETGSIGQDQRKGVVECPPFQLFHVHMYRDRVRGKLFLDELGDRPRDFV